MQFNSTKISLSPKQEKLRAFSLLVLALGFLFSSFSSSPLLALGSQGQFPTSFANEFMFKMSVDINSYFGNLENSWERSSEPLSLDLPHPTPRNRSYFDGYLNIGSAASQLLQPLLPPALNLAESKTADRDELINNHINLGYQYEDQDINALLRLRAQEEDLNLDNIVIMPPLQDNTGELETQLREEEHRYNEIVERDGVTHDRTILIPLNLAEISHWVAVVIRLDRNNNAISISYIDSLGGSASGSVTRSLQRVYGYNINIENTPGLIQSDGTGCGPLIIENLIREARVITGISVVSNELMRVIRAHHVNLAERFEPTLILNKRQQNNSRSFKDISGKIITPFNPLIIPGIIPYNECLKAGLTPVICGGGKNNLESTTTNNTGTPPTQGTEQSTPYNWDYLPDELRLEILDHLNTRDLSKAALVSKEWKRIADDNFLWLHNTQKDFSEATLNKSVAIYKNIVLGLGEDTSSKKDEQSTTDQIQDKYRDYKYIYRISRLIRDLGKYKTKIKIFKEKGELIEVDKKTNNFSIRKLINDITSEDSKTRALSINNINLSIDDIQALAAVLKNQNSKLTALNLVSNQIGNTGTATLAKALQDPNCKLTALNLLYNQIDDVGAEALAKALKNKNSKLTELDLRINQIGNTGAEALAKALEDKNSKLTELNLGINQTGAAGAQALAHALKNKNCKLTALNLHHNQIDDAGAETLAGALKDPSCKLTELTLHYNQIGAAGARALAYALQDKNAKLTELSLVSNEIGDDGARVLAKALQHKNAKITELHLESNQIGDTGAVSLAEALKNPKCKLTKLNLRSNQIGNDGAIALARALKDPNCKVTTLNLWGNQIGDAGAEALAEAVLYRKKEGHITIIEGIENFETF